MSALSLFSVASNMCAAENNDKNIHSKATVIDYSNFNDVELQKIYGNQVPESKWFENKKKIYKSILLKGKYDILVTPIQTQGYSIDRIGRDLMARYLINKIEDLSGFKVVDFTLAARALGENQRHLKDEEVFALANKLGVEKIITIAVGHNLDEKLSVYLNVKIRNSDPEFSGKTEGEDFSWTGLEFSDENQPEEAFKSVINQVIPKLNLIPRQVSRKGANIVAQQASKTLPTKLDDLLQFQASSPVKQAKQLQLFGILHPEINTTQEYLFERSIVVMEGHDTTPGEIKHIILARALYYLNRRPEAIKILKHPKSPEGLALLAYLNGDLPELKRWIAEIEDETYKLFSTIESIDLSVKYEQLPDFGNIDAIISKLEWQTLVARKLLHNNRSYTQVNIEIKKFLDQKFIIHGYTAESILEGNNALGVKENSSFNIDTSVTRHYYDYLRITPQITKEFSDRQLCKLDYLDLLHEAGISNLTKQLNIDTYDGNGSEYALAKLEKLDDIYGGHPVFTYLRGSLLGKMWKPSINDYLLNERDRLSLQAYLWWGGQHETFYSNFSENYTIFDHDYPKRPYWAVVIGDRDKLRRDELSDKILGKIPSKGKQEKLPNQIISLAIDLKYTNNNFYIFQSLYELIKNDISDSQALLNDLLKSCSNRFVGNSLRAEFIAKVGIGRGDSDSKSDVYTKATVSNPLEWGNYMRLGKTHINEGYFDKALDVFLSYPPFRNPGGLNSVALANNAVEAAAKLFFCGGTDQSMQLLKIAAAYDNGSGATIMSAAILAILDNDFPTAADYFLKLTQEYDDNQGLKNYLAVMFAMGKPNTAWSIIKSVDLANTSPEIWDAIIVGQRIASKSSDEVINLLGSSSIDNVYDDDLDRYFAADSILDRKINIDQINKLVKRSKESSNPVSGYKAEGAIGVNATFAQAYYYMIGHDYNQAYNLLSRLRGNDVHRPYFVYSGCKINKFQDVKRIYDGKLFESDDDSYYLHLSKAVMYALSNQQDKSIDHLRLASYRIEPDKYLVVDQWYQLIEFCEWLYDDTDVAGYINLALEWSKNYQRIKPTSAWAYAFEAKYSQNKDDRIKALAIALYLDKNSKRIIRISDIEKMEALKWLENNNPFLKKPSPTALTNQTNTKPATSRL